MKAYELDAALARWIQRQPGIIESSYHVQIKLAPGDTDLAHLTAIHLPGWVVLDWQPRGLGISRKHALPAAEAAVDVAQALKPLRAPLLRAQIQVVVAPTADWPLAYNSQSLAPDLLPVLESGRAHTLGVNAVRMRGDWRIENAHEPPDEEVIIL